ncbi:unnamed protein product [Cunninghamella blakesleeana]
MTSTLLISNLDIGNKNPLSNNSDHHHHDHHNKIGLLRHWSSQPNLRSKASVSLVPMHAQAKTYQQNHPHHCKEEKKEENDHYTSLNPLNTIAYVARKKKHTYTSSSSLLLSSSSSSDINRTQQKLMLQRQCFLADDKNYLDHPSNMKRLTKEMDRINREYNSICQNEINPMKESILRITSSSSIHHHHYVHPLSVPSSSHHHHHPWSSSLSSSSSTSVSNTSLSSSSSLSVLGNGNNVDSYFSLKMTSSDHKSPILQRRASDFMLRRQDRRDSSISIHSTLLQRQEQHHGSKHVFFSRFFKSSLPPTQSNHRHSLLSW